VHVFCAEYAVTCVCLLGYHHLTAILTDEHGSDHDQTLYDHLRVLIYSRKIKLVVKDRYYQTPSNERCTPPTPPDNDVPPMTTAAKVFKRRSVPSVGPAAPTLATASVPATPKRENVGSSA